MGFTLPVWKSVYSTQHNTWRMLNKWNIKYIFFIDQSFEESDLMAYFSATQGVFLGRAASVPPEKVLEMQNLRLNSRITKSGILR